MVRIFVSDMGEGVMLILFIKINMISEKWSSAPKNPGCETERLFIKTRT